MTESMCKRHSEDNLGVRRLHHVWFDVCSYRTSCIEDDVDIACLGTEVGGVVSWPIRISRLYLVHPCSKAARSRAMLETTSVFVENRTADERKREEV
jgi:hypothetical protein